MQILIDRNLGEKYLYLHLLRGRLANLHTHMMSYPTEVLRGIIVKNYEKVIEEYEKYACV